MALSIPSSLIEFILLGATDDRRQLQDSPLLGDVWVKFGERPGEPLDLLIVPYKTQHAGAVAHAIDQRLGTEDVRPNIACLQGLVVACLTFEEVLRAVVPKTKWWIDRWNPARKGVGSPEAGTPPGGDPNVRGQTTDAVGQHELSEYGVETLASDLDLILRSARAWHTGNPGPRMDLPALRRFVVLAGLILWAAEPTSDRDRKSKTALRDPLGYVLRAAPVARIATLLEAVRTRMLEAPDREPQVWQIALNRPALPALAKSIPAVKADAAKTLFKVECRDIVWAVIDSGIDGAHPAFQQSDGGGSRVRRSFDFSHFRRIVSLGNWKESVRKANLAWLQQNVQGLKQKLDGADCLAEADGYLKRLAEDARSRGPIHWELVERFIEIDPATPPRADHGTHVAGILGASQAAAAATIKHRAEGAPTDFADGMCPEISLYDLRVLGGGLDESIRDTEFAIIAALQFIRYLNERDNFYSIHGANLSLSIPHDVRNFACGCTPICNECTRLVESGVVVVAAAGNHGYKSFQTREGSFEGYAAFSITDPGNADSVITVGATHRFWPHTYGVSFFSSRGPTGDGRLKPDLVAPGERIRAPLRGNHERGGNWGDLDGTSMAAPHVSGAAAMLMARYSELIGQPRRIKQILCASATDLGRERSFQGQGMLDVLRAFQSI